MKNLGYVLCVMAGLCLASCGEDSKDNNHKSCSTAGEKICDEYGGLMECDTDLGYFVGAAHSCNNKVCVVLDGEKNASCQKACTEKGAEEFDEANDVVYLCTENSDGTLYLKENGKYYYAKCLTGDDAKEDLEYWEKFSKKSWTETYGEREYTVFKYTNGQRDLVDCNLNSEDVKNNGCPAMYTYCDKPGETMCCGGNAYTCLTDDTDRTKSLYWQLYKGFELEMELSEVFAAARIDNRPIWIPTFCAVEGSTCKVSDDRGAECVMNDLTCQFSEDKVKYEFDGYDMQMSDFVCAKFPKDKGYSPAQTLCHVKKDGSSYVSLFFPLPKYGEEHWRFHCDENGQIYENE